MNIELLLTAAILGVILFHALWRGASRTQARPLNGGGSLFRAPARRADDVATRASAGSTRWSRVGRTAARIGTLIAASLTIASTITIATQADLDPPVLTVASAVVDPGSRVAVRGAGFEQRVQGMLALDGDKAGMPSFHVRDNGTFESLLDLPASLSPGHHVISAVAYGEVATVAFIALTALSPPSDSSASRSAPPGGTEGPIASVTSGATGAPEITLVPIPSQDASQTLAPTPGPTQAATRRPTPTVAPAPFQGSITHVVVVWMENEEASSITSSSMPYLYGLGQHYGRANQYFGVSHPSLPNYLAFWSGSTHGVTDDAVHNLAAPSLSSQMAAAGRSWRIYAQNYPSASGCHIGSGYSGGVDGWGVAGSYARKHDPAMSFTDVSGSAACANIQPLARFDPSVNLAFVVPNLCNDMHDCSLASGDRFLQAFLPKVFTASDWAHTLLVVSFDEGSSSSHGGGQVFTVVARPGLAGVTSNTVHTHYGLLRTIEDIFGLSCLGSACSASPLSEFLP